MALRQRRGCELGPGQRVGQVDAQSVQRLSDVALLAFRLADREACGIELGSSPLVEDDWWAVCADPEGVSHGWLESLQPPVHGGHLEALSFEVAQVHANLHG